MGGVEEGFTVPGVGARDKTGGHFGLSGGNGPVETRTGGSRVLAGGGAGEGEGLHGASITSAAGIGRVGHLVPCGWSRQFVCHRAWAFKNGWLVTHIGNTVVAHGEEGGALGLTGNCCNSGDELFGATGRTIVGSNRCTCVNEGRGGESFERL